jgi:hypothetical protein
MESKAQLIKRARIYDAQERASDHGIGHPGGPTGWRKPRAPPATGAAAKLRRLRKLHPELWRRVMAGELTVGKMELWLGISHRGSLFASEEERRRQWFEHRDRLLQLFAHNGRRPQAWWCYESPVPWPGFNLEKSTLWAARLLGTAEARHLEEHWRSAFDESLAPGFTFQGLTGRDAHVAFLVFNDVPAALAEEWAAALDAA